MARRKGVTYVTVRDPAATLRELVTVSQLTVRELGVRAGCSGARVSQLASGKSPTVDLRVARRLARSLGQPTSALFRMT